MLKVLTVGVFDLFHYGHLNLFRNAKNIVGDDGELIVAIQEDDVVLKYKPDTKLVYPYNIRFDMVQAIRYVDKIISYRDVDEIVKTADFDIFAIGGDQNHAGFQRAVKWCEENGKKVVRLPRTQGISSSQLKFK